MFKSSNWSEKNCILLYSFNPDIQKNINARNKFIIDRIKNHLFKLVKDDKDLEEMLLIDSDNKHYGRAIVITDGNDTYYCGVNGYYIDGQLDKKLISYENL